MTQLLPIGIQTFREIRERNYIYVDKTRQIHELITQGKTYFISRPRRFGKSLLISTLKEIFEGNRELFSNLRIGSTDYDWPEHPVVRIDFSVIAKDNPAVLEKSLRNRLEQIAAEYNVVIDKTKLVTDYFQNLIRELSKINKVAILIDEYDSPIIRHISNADLAVPNREFLKEFYTVMKGEDEHIKFILLTGVSKFSKVGVFSGLNNLLDITMMDQFADLLGWTQEELEENFEDRIAELAREEEITIEETIKKIRRWYNGYQFSKKAPKVYNPFSTLILFRQRSFGFHWFETGTPTFLVKLIKSRENFSLKDIVNTELTEGAFSSYEVENLTALPLLVQTGYLTIKEYDKETRLFRLDYPNYEVNNAFNERLINSYSHMEAGLAGAYIIKLIRALNANNPEKYFEILRIFFANIPYAPNSPYSASKAASDHLARAWFHTYNLPILITNCSNNYGPYQFPEKLIPVVIFNAINNKPVPIYGDGGNVRDWLYVTDHCKGIYSVVKEGKAGETYNIGGDNQLTNLELAQTICKLLDKLRPKDSGSYLDQIEFVKDRPGHDRRYAVDSSKIRRELGWKPEESFESGIMKTIHWYLENTQWIDNILSGGYKLNRLGLLKD